MFNVDSEEGMQAPGKYFISVFQPCVNDRYH